jgi:hypothetical protein
MKGEIEMDINEKVLNDFLEGKIDEEFMDYVKLTLSFVGMTNRLNNALTVAEDMTFKNPKIINKKVIKSEYDSALILLLLFEFLDYKSFKRQIIDEL